MEDLIKEIPLNLNGVKDELKEQKIEVMEKVETKKNNLPS